MSYGDEWDDDLVNDQDEEHAEAHGDWPRLCHECKQPTIGEQCGFCGNELCPFCFSAGGGFCSAPHTYEQICAYEDALMGPPPPERLRERQAHRELVAMGVMPGP